MNQSTSDPIVKQWQPLGKTGAKPAITEPLLNKFIDIGMQPSQLTKPLATLTKDESQAAQTYLTFPSDMWQPACAELDEKQMHALIRFFTMVEASSPDSYAGDKSAVIPLTQLLKKQGKRLSPELLQWIKQHNDNRFLPHGNISL